MDSVSLDTSEDVPGDSASIDTSEDVPVDSAWV